MLKSIALLAYLTFACAQTTFAQLANPLEQLRAKNVAGVEEEFSALQKRFETGEASEYELLDAYKVFYQRDDRHRPELDEWIESFPNSSSAYLARGVYYRKLGEFRRGAEYSSQVPSENLVYMEKMFAASKPDLEMALHLNPKSYLAALNLLNIALFQSDDRAADKYLTLGNAVLPTNFIVRARYLIGLAPKWGGSHKSMEEFIAHCRSQGLAQDKVDLLNAIRIDDQGTVAEESGNFKQARAEYKRALVLARSAGKRFRQDYLGSSARICGEPEHRGQDYCR